MKHTLKSLAILSAILAISASSPLQRESAAAAPGQTWDEQTVELFSRLPIQDGGRVKPLSTFARFSLVKLSGRASYRDESGERVSATRWLLDVMFFPHKAFDYKVIRIENPAVMQALGLPDSHKRSYFSFHRLQQCEARLLQLARNYSRIEVKERSMLQSQILNLYDKYAHHAMLGGAFEFTRLDINIDPDGPLAAALIEYADVTDPNSLTYSQWIEKLPAILGSHGVHASLDGEAADGLSRLVIQLEKAASASEALTVLPRPSQPAEAPWLSPGGALMEFSMAAGAVPRQELAILQQLESLPGLTGQPEAMNSTLADLNRQIVQAAATQGHDEPIALEVFFYKLLPFQWSLILFILSFLLVAVSWLGPKSKWLGRIAAWSTLPPTALLIAGITLRCFIRGRPPISNLYETLLFVPAVAIVTGLAMEWINRKRVALALVSVIGVAGLFVANIYEMKDGRDTMESLVAVLNSNFWLATHVTTISIGYSAGLLAAAVAHIYIFARAFGYRRNDKAFYRSIASMVYGIICFGALFSFLGTVLGGIWANYSWGRFWGWDPKENGALLLILCNLIILHAKRGGFIRDLGLCLSAVFGGMVVAFSWWGVNLLGVGLHSYGFISGVLSTLTIFWGIETLVILFGIVAYKAERPARLAHAHK